MWIATVQYLPMNDISTKRKIKEESDSDLSFPVTVESNSEFKFDMDNITTSQYRPINDVIMTHLQIGEQYNQQ